MVRLFADPACNLAAGPIGLGVGALGHADGDQGPRAFCAGRALGDVTIAGAAIGGTARFHLPADDAQAVERGWAEENV